MKKCAYCEKPLAEDTAFCHYCGGRVQRAGAASTDDVKVKKSWLKRPWPYIALAVFAVVFAVLIVMDAAQDVPATVINPPSVTIAFNDDNLENAVREKLSIWGKEITPSDVEGITALELEQKDIKNISALAYFTQLRSLDLSGNQIADIGPLSQLKLLDDLRLDDNRIDNVEALAGLTELKNLSLNNNQINDMDALSALSSLQSLSLCGNQISDISALSQTDALKQLALSDNAIESIEPLSALSMLENVSLSNNNISDIQPLEHLTNIKQLELADNQISEVSALQNCTGMTELLLQNNPVTDISVVNGMQSLVHINIEGTQVSDISAIIQTADISIDTPEAIELSLPLGAYFMIDDLRLPLDVGDSVITWSSSDTDVVTIEDGKVQVTNKQTNALYERFDKTATLLGQVENMDIAFSCQISVSHDSYSLDYDDKKTTYTSGSMKTTGYAYLIEPQLENVIGADLDYNITITKGKLEKFTLRAYINGKWKNIGEINAKKTPSGVVYIDFGGTVNLSKYWVIATGSKAGSWNDFSIMSTVYYAQREADLGDLHKDAVLAEQPDAPNGNEEPIEE